MAGRLFAAVLRPGLMMNNLQRMSQPHMPYGLDKVRLKLLPYFDSIAGTALGQLAFTHHGMHQRKQELSLTVKPLRPQLTGLPLFSSLRFQQVACLA